jgi:hypothetical protein
VFSSGDYDLTKLGQLRDDGTIANEEFENQEAKLLA